VIVEETKEREREKRIDGKEMQRKNIIKLSYLSTKQK